MNFKPCKTCLLNLPHEDFYRNKKGSLVLFSECKKCFNLRCRNYRKNNWDKVRATEKRHYSKCRESRLKQSREYYSNLRHELFKAYGNKCACCGDTNKEFFAVDHILGGGTREKAQFGTRPLYLKIRSEGYPKDKYQILCHNCNMSIGFYGYCPHNPSLKRPVKFGGKPKSY